MCIIILNYFSVSIFILEIMKSNHLMIEGANLLDGISSKSTVVWFSLQNLCTKILFAIQSMRKYNTLEIVAVVFKCGIAVNTLTVIHK